MTNIGCKYCNPNSDDNCIYQESLTDEWYYYHKTSEWDDYDDDFIYDRIYINYCPWCGRELGVKGVS